LTETSLDDRLLFAFFQRVGIFLNSQEVIMRYIGLLLLASLLAIGCGSPAKGTDPHNSLVDVLNPPSIMALSPDSVPVNSVPFIVTVNGSNFGGDAVVWWNGAPLSTRFVTSNQLMGVLTSTDLMFAGQIPVYVRTGGQNSNTVVFNVTVLQ
jgi:IPT/TIG domain